MHISPKKQLLFLYYLDNSDNPIVLLRDTLKYPSPTDPHNATGWLERQKTTVGQIEAMGKL